MKAHLTPLVVALALSGCSFLGLDNSMTYRYTALDSTGAAVAEGVLEIDFGKRNSEGERRIQGTRRIRIVADSAVVGPQVGASKIQGEEEDGFVMINLNPDGTESFQIGEVVRLRGHLLDGEQRIEGSWSFIRHAGPARKVAKGPFRAVMQ